MAAPTLTVSNSCPADLPKIKREINGTVTYFYKDVSWHFYCPGELLFKFDNLGLNSNGCQVAIGNNFEKLTADSLPLVTISDNHFLTQEIGTQISKMCTPK